MKLLMMFLMTLRQRNPAPLMNAAGSGDISEVRKLLAHGADPNGMNEYGETPLHVSAIPSDPGVRGELLKMLLAAGGDASGVTNGIYEGHAVPVKRSVLMWWLPHCHLDSIEALIAAGADVRFINEEGESALMLANKAGARCSKVRYSSPRLKYCALWMGASSPALIYTMSHALIYTMSHMQAMCGE